jgi:hypothetical protein
LPALADAYYWDSFEALLPGGVDRRVTVMARLG